MTAQERRRASSADGEGASPPALSYRRSRRLLLAKMLGAWLGLLALWLASGFLIPPAGSTSPLAGLAAFVLITAPLALVFVLPVYFVLWWSRSRVDSWERRPEADGPDRFPSDRTVSGEGPFVYAGFAIAILATTGGLPWLYLGEGGASPIARAVVVDLVVVTAVVIAMPRIYRRGLRETPQGLEVRSAIQTWTCPWTRVRGFTYNSDEFQALIHTDLDDGRPAPAIRLATRTHRGRARARHNLRVLWRWTSEHDLAGSGVSAALLSLDGVLPTRHQRHLGARPPGSTPGP